MESELYFKLFEFIFFQVFYDGCALIDCTMKKGSNFRAGFDGGHHRYRCLCENFIFVWYGFQNRLDELKGVLFWLCVFLPFDGEKTLTLCIFT